MRQILFLSIVGAFCACVAAAAAATPADCTALKHHGRRSEAQACYESLTRSSDPYVRAEGDWGLELYQDASSEFKNAVAQADGNAQYRVRWGLLFHERFNNPEAATLFNEALQRDPKNAGAYIGLALVSADGFDNKAREYATKALQLDPKSAEAHELIAQLALEDYDTVDATAQADRALAIDPEALDAIAIHAAVELLADRSPDAWLQKMLAINPIYGSGYAHVASNLVINRRYEEGIAYYRKAVALDPRLWSARSELAINLMRLGQEDEPRQLLETSYNNGYRDAATVNSLRLLDSYKNFTTFKSSTSILRLDAKEADVLRPYFDDVMKRSITTYSQKYKMTLPGPVQVEVYPNHDDFAVRTYGMPGLGALGVTFGTVIAMDSPSGRKPGSFNWASTLWHEMDHVFVLTATHHRVPRWFAEGLAVHEEGEANRAWANRLTPDIVIALQQKKLLPVADLDRGFVHPDYPEQILVSYYQAGRICDYIQSRWGADKLVDMVKAFAEVRPTGTVLQDVLGLTPQAFDQQFLAWLDKDVGGVVAGFDEWRTRMKKLVDLFGKGQYDEALVEADAVRRLYPEYVEEANPYELIADIQTKKGDHDRALAALLEYQTFGGQNPATLKRLAALQEESGQLDKAASTLEAINDIYPVNDEELHRHLGDLRAKQNDNEAAVREYASVVALHPLDKAGAMFNLARAYFAAHQYEKAEESVLAALEAAPGYRPAQQLLLQIEDAKPQRADDRCAAPACSPNR